MPKLKPGMIIPDKKENAAITAAARRDPDAKLLTEAEWKVAKQHACVGVHTRQQLKVQVN